MVPYMTMMTLVTIDRAILIMMTHMTLRSGMVVMVRWKVKCVMIPTDRILLVVETIFSQAWSGDRSTNVVFTPKPTVTEVGDRPSSIGPNRPADKTESCRTAFGADFGNPGENETNVTRTLVPDDTEVGDQPSSSNSDHPRETESHRIEFGVECGNQSIGTHRNRMMREIHSHPGQQPGKDRIIPDRDRCGIRCQVSRRRACTPKGETDHPWLDRIS